MKNHILLFLFTIIFSGALFAQKTCGADEVLKKNLTENPEKVIIRNQLNEFTKEFEQLYSNTAKMDENYTIPVVIHVIHEYGEENISDIQIANGMQLINEDFNAQNSDIVDAIDEFSDLVADFGLEFRLATIDPDGNCTHGITRTASPLTDGQDGAVKSLISWPQENYVNIYVIKNMSPGSSAAAYANYPGAGDPIDGIVCLHNYFGSGEGTAGSGNWTRHTLPHEMGHFFNLAHPWGSTNEPGVTENCGTDDEVDDTPNTIGSSSTCNLYQESCGSLDNVQNIMDYSTCAKMFTQGQKARVHAALNSMAGDRENLWQEENLILTGTDDVHFNSESTYLSCIPVPDFNTTTNTGCQGSQIQFESYTYNSDNTYYYWNFGEGAMPAISTLENPTVTYNDYGPHNVTLKVCNGPESDEQCRELTRDNYIYILDDVEVGNDGINQNFNADNFPEDDGWYIVNQETEDTWATTNIASWNDETSIRIRSRYFGYELNNHTFTTPELDLSGLSTAQMYFNLAYALKSNQTDFEGNLYIQDKLIVYTSDDCGETWMERKTYNTEDLITVVDAAGNPLPVFNNFVPQGDNINPGNWEERSFSLNNVAGDSGVIIKFEFTGIGLDEDGVNKGGNWLYLDNLRIGNNFTDLNENTDFNVKLFPNPSNGIANIGFDLFKNEKVVIELLNVLGSSFGTKTMDLNKGSHELSLSAIYGNIPTGSYLMSITIGAKKHLKKLTVIR